MNQENKRLTDIEVYVQRFLRFPGNAAEYKMDNRIVDLSISTHLGELVILENTYLGMSTAIIRFPLTTNKHDIEEVIAKLAVLIDTSWYTEVDAKEIFQNQNV
jgi:hypothetical protein